MIERDRTFDTFEIHCDGCSSETVDIDTDGDWSAMIVELKELGWKIRPIDDGADFEHIGPACVQAENDDPFLGAFSK